MLIDFAKVPPYRKYDPDRPPSSLGTGGIADEFIGGPSLTWRWGNQGTSTIAYSLDQAHLTVPSVAGENLRVRWTTGADGSATDWVATLSMEWDPVANFNSAGIALLVAGDETTPTDIQTCARLHSTSNSRVVFARFDSYTSFDANTDISSGGEGLPDSWLGPTYLQMRYVSSTKELSCSFATRSRFFEEFTKRTLAAHPTTSIGFFINASNASVVRPMYVNFFRQRTDATGTTAPYPCGE